MKSIKILLLEDSPDDAELVLLELKRGGFEPEYKHVDSGEAFREHLSSEWDIILADYSLPNFNALNALKFLRESALEIPLIIVSGSIGEDLAVAAIKAGAFDYVIKDRLARLPQAITHAISQKSLLMDKRKSEEDRVKLEEQLRQAQKMEAIGQLAGGVAHDFNNILQIILGNGSILQEEYRKEGRACSELDDILNAAIRAEDLTRRLLAFGRRQILQSVDLNLNELVNNLLKLLTRIMGENIRLDFIPGHHLGVVHVDPGQIDQVLMNLIINARDAMPNGGKITIETENVTVNGEYTLTHPWVKIGRYVLLSIGDTGFGMDNITLNRIFEPFFTTKALGKGTGLGLAMVYGIVKQHNGFIHVYSEPDRGTIFKIYLPIVERQATHVDNKIQTPVKGGKETILVAEDDDAVRDLTRRVLTDAGYRCHMASDGAIAVQVFEAHSESIDFVVVDAIMPKMDGRVVYEHIRKIRPDMQVLFCSGYSVNTIPAEFLSEQDVGLIQKPYAPDTLLRKIREMLDRK